ncbi:MAG: DUF998 domain-containing protein [Bacteroidetes bacterium]|nr:DUF998 domain-containing protein [Bacteroidota bacterium]
MKQAEHLNGQKKWQRIILLTVLGYEGLGALLGGCLLVAEPDGQLMDMPVDLMHGAFSNFLIPGIILFALGVLNVVAFFAVLRRTQSDWLMAGLAMGGLNIWFWIEIAILQVIHWLHLMWGLPVIIGTIAGLPLVFPRHMNTRKWALACGIIASVLYIIINMIVPAQWPEYNSITQTVSELSAVAAPTRKLWMVLCTPYSLFMIAFAWGVWKSAGANKKLRIAGALLVVYGITGVFWPFAPMHLRETLAAGGGTISDTMHLVLAGVTQVIYLVALGLSAAALGKGFRIYSILTFIILAVFGFLTFLEAPNVSTNQPTPTIGIWERINIGVFLLWVIVLAIVLMPEKDKA